MRGIPVLSIDAHSTDWERHTSALIAHGLLRGHIEEEEVDIVGRGSPKRT